MKLELKHLAGYLPYGLKCLNQHLPDKEYLIEELKGIENHIVWSGKFDAKHGSNHIPIAGIKPILRPLSDLTNNILNDENDKNYNLSCELADLLNTNDCSHFVNALIENKYYAIDVRLWKDIEEWFYKNHFDWKYNLIEKGLAIDINTINK